MTYKGVVYIATRGELSKGYRILGVFPTHSEAIKCALAEEAHFDSHEWVRHDGGGFPDVWVNGCDIVSVTPYAVKNEFKSE